MESFKPTFYQKFIYLFDSSAALLDYFYIFNYSAGLLIYKRRRRQKEGIIK